VLRNLGNGLRSILYGFRQEVFVVSDQLLLQILMGMDELAIDRG
jgi:hypothetical protein